MSDFYEDDEPVEKVRAAFDAAIERGVTGPRLRAGQVSKIDTEAANTREPGTPDVGN